MEALDPLTRQSGTIRVSVEVDGVESFGAEAPYDLSALGGATLADLVIEGLRAALDGAKVAERKARDSVHERALGRTLEQIGELPESRDGA